MTPTQTATAPALLSIEGLHKSYGPVEVLKGVDLEVHRGEVVVILGPSGSGKSTMLRCINRLEDPTGGEIWFEDIEITHTTTNINEVLLMQTADTMVKNGMRDAGYTYIVIDDCWSLRERDENGNLVPDPAKFPSGMKALGEFLHARGFKFGIYGCAGSKTCGGYPGSQGHE